MVTAILKDLAVSLEDFIHYGDLLPPIGKDLEGDREVFHFVDEERLRFTHILNNFLTNGQSHESITKYYYIVSFPTNISVFVKCVATDTLALKFV